MSESWDDIAKAPRDGTPVEIRNDYGIRPTYGLFRWLDPRGWLKVGDDRTGVVDGPHLTWRPYGGDPASYVDPTNGAQDTREYWLPAPSRGLTPGSGHGMPFAASARGANGAAGAMPVAFVDMSSQVYGKYQHTTQNKADGLFYADSDFANGFGGGPLRPGALPDPQQSTPEATARAKLMHEASANRAAAGALSRVPGTGGTGAYGDIGAPFDAKPILWPWLASLGLVALLGLAFAIAS